MALADGQRQRVHRHDYRFAETERLFRRAIVLAFAVDHDVGVIFLALFGRQSRARRTPFFHRLRQKTHERVFWNS